MAKTIVGLYDTIAQARAAIQDLQNAGIPREDISLMARNPETGKGEMRGAGEETKAGEGAATGAGIGAVLGGIGGLVVGLGALAIPGIGPIVAAGPLAAALAGAGIGAGAGALVGALVGMGIPDEEAQYYAEGVRRGGTLVAVRADEPMTNRIIDIMERHDPVDIDRRAAEWRTTGWKGWDEHAGPYTERETMRTTDRPMTRERDTMRTGETHTERGPIKEIREDVNIGKREVVEGGKRIRSHVISEPVEKDVTLREEEVRVERRPVDRPATEGEVADAFREKTIEMHERSEEPVVRKEARVTGEVELDKDVTERTETVRDRARRTEVEVENLGPGERRRSWETYNETFRNSFATDYPGTRNTYDYYQPAYRYGYDLASDPQFRDRDWNQIEPEVRRRWEREHPDSAWEEFKDTVHRAWMKVRGERVTR